MFVSKHHEHMIGDLVKMLKGEEVDDVSFTITLRNIKFGNKNKHVLK